MWQLTAFWFEGLSLHCTMRTLESRNSSGLIAPGHISKNHQRYSKERHFFFKLSTRRKIEKIQFPWVSYSKFSILAKYASVSYTQICIWYRAILLEDASDASVPLYKYGSILHTVPPYFPMYALCIGPTTHSLKHLHSTALSQQQLLISREVNDPIMSDGGAPNLLQCEIYFCHFVSSFKNFARVPFLVGEVSKEQLSGLCEI